MNWPKPFLKPSRQRVASARLIESSYSVTCFVSGCGSLAHTEHSHLRSFILPAPLETSMYKVLMLTLVIPY